MDNKNLDLEVANEVAKETNRRDKEHKDSMKTARCVCICFTVLMLFAMACGTVLAWHSITEKQYALNMQFAQMADIAAGTTVYETGEAGTIVQGDSNTTAGGDINGESCNP